MKHSKLKTSLILLLLIVGTCFIVGYNLLQQREEVREKIIERGGYI